MTPRAWHLLWLVLLAGPAAAAEVASNGTGGGPWTDPATWRGNAVPGAADDVVIRKFDVVTFDRDGGGKPSCRKLLVDPKGVLLFKTGVGKLVCAVAEEVEAFGTIKLDGTKAAADAHELRLLGDTPEKRRVKLGRGGGLLLYGRAGLSEGKQNAALTAPAGTGDELPGLVEADRMTTIDWQRARVDNVKLVAKNLDNTGARPNERINVIECEFTGQGRILCEGCDTPAIRNNRFSYPGAKPLTEPAINVAACPLAEIKGNTVRGGFALGIGVSRLSDGVLIGNVVEKCGAGVGGGAGLPNLMVKDLTVRGCEVGLRIEGAPGGVLEGVTVDGATTALHVQNATLQLTDFRVKDLALKGVGVVTEGGVLRLLGGNLTPYHFKVAPPAGATAVPVTAVQHLVVTVKGGPPGALVAVRTNDPKLPADAADPNVRNSPAAVVDGQTPAPRSFTPLAIKTWSLGLNGQLSAAPEYTVTVLGPPASEGAARPVLKTMTFAPPPPAMAGGADHDPVARLEVSLK